MAQGNNQIAQSLLELQPTAVLEFFIIYPDILNYPTLKIFIHAGSLYDRTITWQGNTYIPVAIEVDGFEQNATSQLARPRIKVSNKDFLVTKLLQTYDDLKNAEVVRKRTFAKFLDDTNFDGGNPYGTADSSAELASDRYIIGQKVAENKVYVELELASPLDLENFEVNHRRILGKYCYWQYRGEGCNYQGIPIQQGDGKPFTNADGNYVVPDLDQWDSMNPQFMWNPTTNYQVGECVFLENNKVLIHSIDPNTPPAPMKNWYVAIAGGANNRPDVNPTYWAKDSCNKKLSSCRLRFSDDALIAYQEGQTNKSYDTIEFAANWNKPNMEGTGKVLTQANAVTEVFTDSDFTVALWVEHKQGNFERPGLIQTADNRTINTFAFQADVKGGGSEKAYLSYDHSHTESFTLPLDKVSLLIIEKDHPNNKIRVYVNDTQEKTKEWTPRTNHQYNATEFALGINEWYDSKNRTMTGAFGPCAIWHRKLTDKERGFLASVDENGDLVPSLYADMTGQLRETVTGDRLVAWWETTGDVDGSIGFLDTHESGFHMTGWGEVLTEEQTYTIDVPRTVYRKEKISILPFGGFPGTDGFSYEA